MGAADATAIVAQIVPAADPSSRSFLVKLDLPASKQLRAGMYATANFPGAMRSVILAPQSAVVMRGSLPCVYALDANGVAQLRYVTLGNRHGDDSRNTLWRGSGRDAGKSSGRSRPGRQAH